MGHIYACSDRPLQHLSYFLDADIAEREPVASPLMRALDSRAERTPKPSKWRWLEHRLAIASQDIDLD
jgi:hypothetical protein